MVELQKKLVKVDKMLELRNGAGTYISSPKEIAISIKVHFPDLNLEKDAKLLIERCAINTSEFGHSPRLDRIKNKAFETLGMCLGEDL